ncbi:hypothetical protein L914_12102, partial [Phytophthora nicotianae]
MFSVRTEDADSDETLELEGRVAPPPPPRGEQEIRESESDGFRMTRLMAVASFKLDFKLQGTANYEESSLRIQTAMLTLNYNRIVLGDEREDDVPPGTRQEQRDW